MVSIKFVLNTCRKNKNGKYPLVIQIINERKKTLIYTPYQLTEDCFDKNSGMVKVKNGNLYDDEVCKYIIQASHRLKCIIEDMKKNEIELSLNCIVSHYKIKQNEENILFFMEALIKKMESEGRTGTANAYRSVLNCLVRFLYPDNDIFFCKITIEWVDDFIGYLKRMNLKINTINFYIRILRAVYNKALDERVFNIKTLSPFHNMMLKKVNTSKRAIDRIYIQRICNANLLHDPELELARDLFLFSFYCRGMPFVDMAYLKYSSISNGSIYYFRSKTKQLLQVKIVPPLNELITKYANDSEYILPIINRNDLPVYTQYRSGLRRHNNNLKRLSIFLDLPVLLTSYVARHSWATIAKFSGIPVAVISEALGHSSESITYTYLATLDPSVINNVNDMIVNSFSC
jgi:site-specific recombinase XerD